MGSTGWKASSICSLNRIKLKTAFGLGVTNASKLQYICGTEGVLVIEECW